MRLCMPTTDDTGVRSRLSPHFGSAPYFTLVDIDSGEASVLVNSHARHEHGQCTPTRDLEGRGVGAVVCRGLGQRALARLGAAGIPVLVTEAWTVGDAVAAYRGGSLRALGFDEACAGHRHGAAGHC